MAGVSSVFEMQQRGCIHFNFTSSIKFPFDRSFGSRLNSDIKKVLSATVWPS